MMRDIWPFVKKMQPFWPSVVWGFVLSFLTVLMGTGLLALSGWFITAAAFAGLSSELALTFNFFYPSAGVRFFAVGRIVSRYAELMVTHVATFKLLADLRVWFFKLLIPLAPAHFANRRSAELLNGMTVDIDTLDTLYLRVITPCVLAVLLSLLTGGFVGHYVPLLGLILMLTLLGTLFGVSAVVSLLGRAPGAQIVQLQGRLRVQIVEGLQGLGELLVFDGLGGYIQQMQQRASEFIAAQWQLAKVQGIAFGVLSLLSGGMLIVGTAMAIQAHQAGQVAPTQAVLLIFTILASFQALVPLPIAFQDYGKITQAAKRLNAVAATEPRVHYPIHRVTLADVHIRFRDVRFAYDGVSEAVYNDFNLDISAGEHVAIRGPSGSGKTTLARLMMRFDDVTGGDIEIGGQSIQQLSEVQLRETVSLLQQFPHIFHGSIRDNLAIGMPLGKTYTDEQLWYYLGLVELGHFVRGLPDGLDTWVGEFGMALSGGQMRRLALARLLCFDTPVMIWDEPTAGLDYETAVEMMKNLRTHAVGKTVICLTHQYFEFDREISL